MSQKIPKLVLQKWKMIWWNKITVSVGISIFENFASHRCCYLFIYLFIKDRTDSRYAQRTQANHIHTPCNDFNVFTATHGLMVVRMFCSFLFFSFFLLLFVRCEPSFKSWKSQQTRTHNTHWVIHISLSGNAFYLGARHWDYGSSIWETDSRNKKVSSILLRFIEMC